jgi:hypothetical protein
MAGPQGFGEALMVANMYPAYPPHVAFAIALLLIALVACLFAAFDDGKPTAPRRSDRARRRRDMP